MHRMPQLSIGSVQIHVRDQLVPKLGSRGEAEADKGSSGDVSSDDVVRSK